MKSVATLLSICLIQFTLVAQVEIDEVTYPDPGDNIEVFVDAMPSGIDVSNSGADLFWDWSLSEDVTQFFEFAANDAPGDFPLADIKMTQGGFDNYYAFNNNAWNLLGIKGQDPFGLGLDFTSFYEVGFSQEYAPLAYGDTRDQSSVLYAGIPLSVFPDSLIALLPVVPDSLRGRIDYQTFDEVDSWGTLKINDRESEVLRQRREQRIAIGLEAKVSILPWVDVTDLLINYVGSLPFEIDLLDTTVAYRYLTPGYALPVAEVTTSGDTIIAVRYQPGVLSAVDDTRFVEPSVQVFPNPTSDFVNVRIPESLGDVDEIRIYDVRGQVLLSRAVAAQQFQLDFSGFSPGIYIGSLIHGGEHIGTIKVQVVR